MPVRVAGFFLEAGVYSAAVQKVDSKSLTTLSSTSCLLRSSVWFTMVLYRPLHACMHALVRPAPVASQLQKCRGAVHTARVSSKPLASSEATEYRYAWPPGAVAAARQRAQQLREDGRGVLRLGCAQEAGRKQDK